MKCNKIIPLQKSSEQTEKPRLALDIGTNSIGWALYQLNEQKKPMGILKAGVRIFSSGRKDKDHTTLAATRREKRLQRRQRDRYLQRKAYVLDLLKKSGLFPEDKFSGKKLETLNPYELRTKGLDEKLELHHFGRALFHINQKRGFKSNRKSDSDKETGLIKESVKAVKELMQKHDSRTYGEFLWKRFQKMEETRKKPGSQQEHWILARRAVGAGATDKYVVYSKREMIEDEFNKLWDVQSKYHEKLKDKDLKKKFLKAIFYQRPLKKPIVGKCELIPSEDRISKALPSFQKFRILKELNNLAYIDDMGTSHFVVELERGLEFRDKIIKEFFLQKAKVTFNTLEKEFKKFFPDIDNFSKFNLDSYNRDDLEGEKTALELKKIIPDWSDWEWEDQDRFIELLEGENVAGQFIKDDKEVLEDLQKFNEDKRLNLSSEQIEECLIKLNKLPSGHGKYSKAAIQKILPFLEKGELEYSAISSADLDHNSEHNDEGEWASKLPGYQTVLSDHCTDQELPIISEIDGYMSFGEDVKGKRKLIVTSEENEQREYLIPKGKYISVQKGDFINKGTPLADTKRIPNPTVHIAFNQLRVLVNDIIRVYGKPAQIVVETARDLPMGAIAKKKLEKSYKENKDRNKEAEEAISEYGQNNNRENCFRYRLWKEQKETCIYSGKKVPKTKLWTSDLEVDHILPWSKTLDNSFSNKVLVYKSSNQNKSDKTPYDFFSSDENRWKDILNRVKDLPKNKQWRFKSNAMEKFQDDEGFFLARQLNDTRYISKYAKKYLSCICNHKHIWTVRGQTTSIVRGSLFGKTETSYLGKNRNDHRNHVIDALVIGLIDRSFVQKISTTAKQVEGQNRDRLENIGKVIKTDALPWASFKEDAKKSIDRIIVSHRKRTKREGQLHNETAYGVSSENKNFKDPMDVIHYKDILSFKDVGKQKIEKIISDKIRDDFLKELEEKTKISKEFIENYHKETGIRRVRIKEKETVIPIKDKNGKIYKAFQGGGNYAMRLFEKSNGKWDAEVISIFNANQKDFTPIPKRKSLMRDDMIFFENKFWRVVKLSKDKITLSEHFEANVDSRNRSRTDNYQYMTKSPRALQRLSPKRVDISPCGKVKLSSFDLSEKFSKVAGG